VNVYADASLLVALLIRDAFNQRAQRFLAARPTMLLISDFAAAEFVAVVGRRVRVGELTTSEALTAFASLDEWVAAHGPRLELVAADVVIAETFLRRLDLGLRAPDAIHLAIAQRHGAALATFDERMAASANALGMELAPA
jgi:predicted nucleic acid-binding protein